jgi:hypothetical protein
MRAELLAHLEHRVAEARSNGTSAEEAAAYAIGQLGEADALRAELQQTVPAIERIVSVGLPLKGGADQWFDRRAGESLFHYAGIRTLYTSLMIFAIVPSIIFFDELPKWIAIASGQTSADPEWLMRHAVLPVAIFSANAAVTFLVYVLSDVSGIREVLSRASPAGAVRKSIALGTFIAGYLVLLVVSAVWITVRLNPTPTHAQIERLTPVMGVLVPPLVLFFALGIPVIAWVMTKEHQHYEKWGRLKIDE